MGYVVFACICFAIACIVRLGFFKRRYRNLPPSPAPCIPVIGHMYLIGKSIHQSLFQLYLKHGLDLMFLKLGSLNSIVVSSPAMAKEVLKTQGHVFASRPETMVTKYFSYNKNDVILAPYGESWRHLRRLCTLELFNMKRAQQFKPIRKQEVLELLSDLSRSSGKKTNLTSKVTYLFFNITVRIVCNKSFTDSANSERERERALTFIHMLMSAMEMAGTVYIGDFIPYLRWLNIFSERRIRNICKKMFDFLQEELEEHKANQGKESKDFMDVMLSWIRDGLIQEKNAKAIALDVFGGGTDPGSILIDWAMCELLRNPAPMQKVLKELEGVTGRSRHLEEEDIPKLPYLQAVVKETFRLHPPAPLLVPRESTEECKLSGFTIPAKTRVLVNAYAIGRDPSVWKEPLRFDPDRFLNSSIDVLGHDYELIPFGAGRRICGGVHLGLVQVHYILGSLLNVFDWSLPDGLHPQEIDMSERIGQSAPRASALEVVPWVNKNFADKFLF